MFFPLDGTMSYQAGSALYRLCAGYFNCLPKGVPHSFRITGSHRSDSLRSPCRAD